VSSPAETLSTVVGAFVGELAAAGVHHACACPGSRSTPLAVKLAEQSELKLWMHLDERSAGYFGLGLARALREPVALLATSGTAAANFLPAVVEARLARVPLVVLTGDRPHELRDNGAPQTIDQLRLYGEHVKWFFDLPEPHGDADSVALARTVAARAVGTALAEPAGPVHLNWPFREPLMPARGAAPESSSVRVRNPRLAAPPDLVVELAASLARQPHGLIVVGPQDDSLLADAVSRLAARLGYPVLADGLSGLRWGAHDRSLVIDAYDAYLRDPACVHSLGQAEVIVRIGAIPTSKPLQQYLQGHTAALQILVDPGGWRDPTNRMSEILHVDPRQLCDALADVVPAVDAHAWADRWRRQDATARQAIQQHLASQEELSEGNVFARLASLLPEGALLYAGNSMPVRDLDTFLPQRAATLRCLSNRGANGIDGVVSSALGASAAGLGPVVLAIGDISFYHDLNGLLAARQHALDLLIILLNNDGGGIFSFLPQAESASEHFELLFGTPHGLDFQPFVEGYGGRFARVDTWSDFGSAVADGLRRGGLRVVEVPTERERNVAQHRAVWRAVAEAYSPSAVA
jgi:2-succinyl-5-enolpyruvyl-6-hydroxy-3-cyclohexene-1-carboxylate synthase